MSGLVWKIPLACLLVLLAAATALAVRARMRAIGAHPPPAVVHLGPDGLASAKRDAAAAIDLSVMRSAVREFLNDEGRLPTTLAELAQHDYLPKGYRTAVSRFRYDPLTGDVVCASP